MVLWIVAVSLFFDIWVVGFCGWVVLFLVYSIYFLTEMEPTMAICLAQ